MSRTILVVDDEAPVAEFLRELLESWGISARAVTSPAAALEVFGAERYDLVITDQTMPGTTGFRLARERPRCDEGHILPPVYPCR